VAQKRGVYKAALKEAQKSQDSQDHPAVLAEAARENLEEGGAPSGSDE